PPSPPPAHPLSLHDALPICPRRLGAAPEAGESGRRFALSSAPRSHRPRLTSTAARPHQAACPAWVPGSAWDPTAARLWLAQGRLDRKSTRLNSSHVSISYAV